jgi:hypothetical protein
MPGPSVWQQWGDEAGQSEFTAHKITPGWTTQACGVTHIVAGARRLSQQTCPAPHELLEMHPTLAPESQVAVALMHVSLCWRRFC